MSTTRRTFVSAALAALLATVGGDAKALARQIEALPSPLREEAEAIVASETAPTLSFEEWIDRVNPRFKWHEAARRLCAVLQRVADGDLKRVMVFEPPRHGKTEQVTKLFPSYFLYRHPEKWVGLTAYTGGLANSFSRGARSYYLRGLEQPLKGLKAVVEWHTGEGGGLWAAGIGGSLTGRGFHLGIIDDPVKNAKEAASLTTQQTHRDWYESTFGTRQEDDAAIVIVMTRWHELDLAGWLLSKENDDEPEHWHIVWFPALAEDGLPKKADGTPYFPSTVTLEPDWRKPGEALWPAKYNRKWLEAKRRGMLPYYWNALYQQRPAAREGTAFKIAWLGAPLLPNQVPPIMAAEDVVRYWDEGASEQSGDYTAGCKMMRTKDGKKWMYIVLHMARFQLGPGERDRQMRRIAESDGPLVKQWGQQEPGASGKERALTFVSLMDGLRAEVERITGDKQLRFDPFAAAAQNGRVRYVMGDWNQAWLNELAELWTGTNDDQAEVTAGAYAKLAGVQSLDPRDWPTQQ